MRCRPRFVAGGVSSCLTTTVIALAVLLSACSASVTATPQGSGRPPTAAPAPPRVSPTPQPKPSASPVPIVSSGGSRVEQDLVREAALQASAQTQRVIVRTVDMTLVVADVSKAMNLASEIAASTGGWVVASSQTGPHGASISIRVPADRLDRTVSLLRDTAVKVESEVSQSEDFTDEYVDSTARVKNLQATQAALAELLKRAEKVDDALKIQAELTKVQEAIEKLRGRLAFLEQSAAFSLLRLQLKRTATLVTVDAGPDVTAKKGDTLSFRTTFAPPEGIADFTYTWDFGDGSAPVGGYRTAPLLDSLQRATATVSHQYSSSSGSPYVVTVHLVGKGDAGAIEGDDTLVATVLEVPSIEIFAGEDLTLTEGQWAEFSASFTQPQGLRNYRYQWDFGDGSPLVSGSMGETAGANRTTARHRYTNYRPKPFLVTLRVMASGDAGEVVSSGQVNVHVEKRIPLFLGWSVSRTTRWAVLILTSIGIAIGTVLIFAAILSPVWITVVLAAWLLGRRRRNRGTTVTVNMAEPPGPPAA